MKKYQYNFSAHKPLMFDKKSRVKRALRIVKVLEDYLGKEKLKHLSLLDVGSSAGILDNSLADKFKTVVGIDIDKKAINFAKTNFKKNNLKFKAGDAMKLNFPENSFNVVVCAQIYEHVPSPQKLFKEIYRVLKPNGVCYLAAINKLWPWEPHYNLMFLSWLPKSIANQYMKIFNRGTEYYETLKTYWQLEKLTKMFKKIDYTPKILEYPDKFGYEDTPLANFRVLGKLISEAAKYLTPTFFWLLEKD